MYVCCCWRLKTASMQHLFDNFNSWLITLYISYSSITLKSMPCFLNFLKVLKLSMFMYFLKRNSHMSPQPWWKPACLAAISLWVFAWILSRTMHCVILWYHCYCPVITHADCIATIMGWAFSRICLSVCLLFVFCALSLPSMTFSIALVSCNLLLA